jgi:type VI secretion system secreted protein VgrG
MPPDMNAIRDVKLDVVGARWEWSVQSVSYRAALDEPFEIEVRSHGRNGDVPVRSTDLRKLIGARATLILPEDASGHKRVVIGLVDGVERAMGAITLSLVPIGAPKLRTRDYHVDIDKDPVTIAKAFLAAATYGVTALVTRSVPPRPQSIQAFETGQAYVGRLLAEEGIAWFTDPDDSTHVVLCDDPARFPKHPGKFDATPSHGLRTLPGATEPVDEAEVRRCVRTSKVTLRDWKFENPGLDLTAVKDSGEKLALERYEYRGGYDDPALGKQRAGLRLEAHRRDIWTLRGSTPCTTLAPGQIIAIESPRKSVHGDWLITEVLLTIDLGSEGGRASGGAVVARFQAVRATLGARPAVAATLRMPGIQTMTVTGASGEEIHPDEHCRIKTLHRWDREHKLDDKASAWQRVMQPAMPGSMLVPRVGWEAIAGYFGRSAENPVILGRLDTGKAPPPASLPAQKIVSSFGSCTTPGGGSFNGVSFNDTKGGEGMNVTASASYNERTANDKVATVKASCASTIGGDHTLTVGKGHVVKVDGAHSHTISGSRSENVTSNITISAGSEKVGIGGARMFTVAGDQHIDCTVLGRLVVGVKMVTAVESASTKVTGPMTVNVVGGVDQTAGGTWDATVAGIHEEIVTGVKSITCARGYDLNLHAALKESYGSRTVSAGGDFMEAAGGALDLTSNGAASMKGANVVFKGANITLKAGGITITIKPGKVVVDGDYKSSQSAVNDSGEKYG